jgi:putative membrane protein
MKTNTLLFRRAALIVGAFVAAAGFASAKSDNTNNNNPKVHHADKSFVEKAAKSGMEEVSISQIATERSSNPQVKEFATMMVTDHTAANSELSTLASAKGITLPAKDQPPRKWQKKDAKDFDKDYIDKMVDDHEEAVKDFTKEANDGKDTEIQAFARTTLPKLQHHLEQAKDLKRQMK